MQVMVPPELHTRTLWHPAQWRAWPVTQAPGWPEDATLTGVRERLAAQPPLVTAAEVAHLQRRLAQVARGHCLVIHLGDCAETFEPTTPAGIRRTVSLIRDASNLIEDRLQVPTVSIGRIAGQFAKPRSCPTEKVNGVTLPAFRGFLINGLDANPISRRPNPYRMLAGYYHATHTTELLRRTARGGMPMRGHWGDNLPALWISHEALVLDYEEPLTRWDPGLDGWVLTSTHLPWVGDRTRNVDGGHVRFIAGVANPVGCKVGPTMTPDEINRLASVLDPHRQPGRLVLISRLGADRIDANLPKLMEAVRTNGHRAVWLCDPMHGNTVRLRTGHKTRRMTDILAEIASFVSAVNRAGGWPGGLHLEGTADPVTECVGGRRNITDHQVPHAYLTACDPRLNADQTLEAVDFFVRLLGV